MQVRNFERYMNLQSAYCPTLRRSLQTIDPSFTSLYFSPNIGEKREIKLEKFKEGDVFSLQGVECDDFTMPVKEYQVIKKVDEVFGVKLDGLVVKQISGDSSTIFSLTKTDCQTLGIEFQPRLLFFPMNMNWKTVSKSHRERIKEFNPMDFSSYPVVRETEKIERIVVKISNMSNYKNDFLCGGIEISYRDVMGGFMLVVKRPIQTKYGVLNPNRIIHGVNVTSGVYRQQGLVMESGAIYFEFDVMGIEPSSVEGVDFHDLFDVKVMGHDLINGEKPQKKINEEIVVKTKDECDELVEKFLNTINSSVNMRLRNNDLRTRMYNNYDWRWSSCQGANINFPL